jgi:RNA polymerase sigma-70 factor (ECF subfamily)
LAYDQELWERIRRGDAAAFDVFYCETASRLHAFLRLLVGSHSAAEDIVQETFLELWRRPRGYQSERGPLRAYLFGVGRKRAAEWWRKQSTRSEPRGSLAMFCTTESDSLVGDAFARLPCDQQTLLWLREVEGQSYAELADILDIPVGTVRSRLFTARENLRKIWHGAIEARKERV